jgi:hypothetical protein
LSAEPEAVSTGWELGWEAVAALAAIFAVWVACRQLGGLKRSTNAQLAADLHRRLFSDETRKTMRLIYSVPPDCVRYLSQADRDRIEEVLNLLNMVGALLRDGTIDERLAAYTLGGAKAVRCWYRHAPRIAKERRLRRGKYCGDLEYFAKRVVQRQLRSDPVSEWICLSSKPLIAEELKKPHLLDGCDVWKAKAVRSICGVIECMTGCKSEYDLLCAGPDRQWICFGRREVTEYNRQEFRTLLACGLLKRQQGSLLSGWELSRALLCRSARGVCKTELQWRNKTD